MDTKTLIGFVSTTMGVIGSFVTIGIMWGEFKQKLAQVPGTIDALQRSMTERIDKLAKDTDERLDGHDVSIKDLYDSRLAQTATITKLSENISFIKEQQTDMKNNINQISNKLDFLLQELSKKGV